MMNYTVKIYNENSELYYYTVEDAISEENALHRALIQYKFTNDSKVTKTEIIERIK